MHLFLRRTAVALSLILAAAIVHADELQDINRMMKQGQLPQSLERVDKYLAGKPSDAQGRFLKGLILTEMHRPNEAIQVFLKLTKDYPKLPEPYNNLAVLYASQGHYEKARVALEDAIRTHPSYATAHENLGDIYAKLASQAYDKALQLDASNTGAKTKLAMIDELIGSGTRTAGATARTEPVKTAQAAPATTATGKAEVLAKAESAAGAKAAEPKKAEPKAAQPKAPEPKKAEPKAAQPKAPEPKKAEPKAAQPKTAEPAAKASGGAHAETDAVVAAVRAWAGDWSRKDVTGYLAHYAEDFKTPKGESRGDWEKGRRQRIDAPKHIEVEVLSPKVSISDDDAASVTFRQVYRSNTFKATGTKTLVMVKRKGKWLIHEERVN
jgi:tetratricopeptide (TPR) repeat protein